MQQNASHAETGTRPKLRLREMLGVDKADTAQHVAFGKDAFAARFVAWRFAAVGDGDAQTFAPQRNRRDETRRSPSDHKCLFAFSHANPGRRSLETSRRF